MNLSPKKVDIIKYTLLAVVVVLTFYLFQKNNDYKGLQKAFDEDKQALQTELDNIVADYKDLSKDRKDISVEMINEINKIIALSDSVKTMKSSNYGALLKFRKRLAYLQKQNRLLFSRVDSLNVINDDLTQENVVVTEVLQQKDSIAQLLSAKTEDLLKATKQLEAKVGSASQVKTSAIRITSMREKNNGKLVETSKHYKTDAFRITFQLLENAIATPERKHIYIQLYGANNELVVVKGRKRLATGKEIEFSDELIANYDKRKMDVLSLISVDRNRLENGKYTVKVFVDGLLTQKQTIELD